MSTIECVEDDVGTVEHVGTDCTGVRDTDMDNVDVESANREFDIVENETPMEYHTGRTPKSSTIRKTLSMLSNSTSGMTKRSRSSRGGATTKKVQTAATRGGTKMQMRMSRSPTPNPSVRLVQAEVHQEAKHSPANTRPTTPTTMKDPQLCHGEMCLLDYLKTIVLVVSGTNRIILLGHCLTTILQICLQRGLIVCAAQLRDILNEWELFQKTKQFHSWKQRGCSMNMFHTEFHDTKFCTLLYRCRLYLDSTFFATAQELLQPIIHSMIAPAVIPQLDEPLSSLVDTPTITTSSTRAVTQTAAVAARGGANLFDVGVTTNASLSAEDGGLRKLFGLPAQTVSTSGICWSMSAEVAGQSATFVSAPQVGYNVLKVDLYDYVKCSRTDKSAWWKEAIVRSVAVTTDANDPIQKQAEKLVDMIATRLATLNPERKTSNTGFHGSRHQPGGHGTGSSHFWRNM